MKYANLYKIHFCLIILHISEFRRGWPPEKHEHLVPKLRDLKRMIIRKPNGFRGIRQQKDAEVIVLPRFSFIAIVPFGG